MASGAVAIAAAIVIGLLLIRSSGPSTQELIQTLISAPDTAERTRAASRLADKLDPAIAGSVARLARTDKNAKRGLRLLTGEYVSIYGEATSDIRRRTEAIRCLARIDTLRSVDAVTTALLEDRDAAVREAAVAALGELPQSSSHAVSRLVRHRQTSVREGDARARQIEHALENIGRLSVGPLLLLVPQSAWALRVIGEIGPQAVAPLRKSLKQGSFRTQVAASHALLAIRRSHPAAVRDSIPVIVSSMMSKLGAGSGSALFSPGEAPAVDVLIQVGRPAVDPLTRLARKEFGASREVKGASTALVTLVIMAETDRKQAAPLLAALRQRDYALIRDLHVFYIHLGVGERGLIGMLNQRRDVVSADTFSLVLHFVASGNPRLATAAREWARRRGATLTTAGEDGELQVRLGVSFPGRATGVVKKEIYATVPSGGTWAIGKSFVRTLCEDGKRFLSCRRSR